MKFTASLLITLLILSISIVKMYYDINMIDIFANNVYVKLMEAARIDEIYKNIILALVKKITIRMDEVFQRLTIEGKLAETREIIQMLNLSNLLREIKNRFESLEDCIIKKIFITNFSVKEYRNNINININWSYLRAINMMKYMRSIKNTVLISFIFYIIIYSKYFYDVMLERKVFIAILHPCRYFKLWSVWYKIRERLANLQYIEVKEGNVGAIRENIALNIRRILYSTLKPLHDEFEVSYLVKVDINYINSSHILAKVIVHSIRITDACCRFYLSNNKVVLCPPNISSTVICMIRKT
ncbi:MAG: hypothetical protein DRZ80_02410 [Thermoprotei archaeon]|nr:MAG: hypothetical protein DRZ80_02410 [Thermoprotei archaeon]